MLQADTIAQRRRARRQEGRPDRLGRRRCRPDINGPTVDFATFYNNRGVLVGAADPVEQAGCGGVRDDLQRRRGRDRDRLDERAHRRSGGDAEGDDVVDPVELRGAEPEPHLQRLLLRQRQGGGVNYDHAIVSPVGKTGAAPSIDLKVGDFKPIKLTGAERPDRRARRPDGRPLREADLARRRPQSIQALRHVARPRDRDVQDAPPATRCPPVVPARTSSRSTSPTTCCRGLPPTSLPRRRGVVDEDTYVQQGRDLERAYSLQVINYVLGTLQPDTELAMVGYPFTDEVSHQFMGLVSPTEPGRRAEPVLRRDTEVRRRHVHRARHGPSRRRSARATSGAPTRTPTRSSASPGS